MADKTFGVKVNEELYEKVKGMIDVSGISAKEWFEKAVSLAEINAIKQGATDYREDLSELEIHTTRIYELVTNMIDRSIYMKDHAIKEYTDKLDQKEAIISEYQEKAKNALEEAKKSQEAVKILEKEKEEVVKQLEDARSINANNQLLIDEYKEKNDTLSGLVAKYQSFAEENEQLKSEYEKDRDQLHVQIQELTAQNQDQEGKVKQLTQQIESMKRGHGVEIERLNEKKDFEKDKALLKIERDYQGKLLAANEEYNEKIKALYDEISAVRKECEERVLKLQEQNQEKKEK